MNSETAVLKDIMGKNGLGEPKTNKMITCKLSINKHNNICVSVYCEAWLKVIRMNE